MARLITALDTDEPEKAFGLAEKTALASGWFKIGLELFLAGGPSFVEKMKAMQYGVFLDLKFYDIPNTVAKAVGMAARMKVDMLTIHCQGGERMCAGARGALEKIPPSQRPLLFGVTALTSFAPGEMPGIGLDPGDFGLRLAANAKSWGLDGVVCSGREVARIKEENPDLLCLCPGIRPFGEPEHDQRRAVTPGQAVAAGADFLVVGRPITGAASPSAAAAAILAEMKAARIGEGA